MPLETRTLPSSGLTISQMAHAIRKVGLEPFMVRGYDYYLIKSTICAYLRCGIPVIAAISLFDCSQDGTARYMGDHAVAITGYRLGEERPRTVFADTGFLSRSSRITKIYVHDDQVGPFARMVFDDKKTKVKDNGRVQSVDSLSTSLQGLNNRIGDVRAVIFKLLTPLYHKIRIPFSLIEKIVVRFDAFLESLRLDGIQPFTERLEWDIYLSTVNCYKSVLLGARNLKEDIRIEILTSSFPRFIWIASAYSTEELKLDLVFDATDIEQGKFFVRAVEHDWAMGHTLRAVSKQEWVKNRFTTVPEGRILEWFSKQELIA